MKRESTFELRVGVFMAIGIIILLIMIFNIGELRLVKKGYSINVRFNFASGITESAPVRLAGVDVGWVRKAMVFYDEEEKKTKVEVLAWIDDEKVKIEKDAQATINTLGLLGEKYLEITPGNRDAGLMKDNDLLIGHDPVVMERLTEKLSEMADCASVVMRRLRDGEGTVGKLLTEEKIYNDLEAFVTDIKAHPWKLLHKPREGK